MTHWYAQDGTPRHFEAPNGKPTTLRQARAAARKGDAWYPSVTTIGQVRHKPALVNWLQEEAVLEAYNWLDKNTLEYDWPNVGREWARMIIAAARERTMAKADEGTEIHDVLESAALARASAALGRAVDHKWIPLVTAVEQCLIENTGRGFDGFTPEQSFCNTEYGYGGKCDLSSPEWVIDYKSKDGVDKTTRGWPEQAEQLAAYDRGLGGDGTARLANIFIDRNPGEPWAVKFYEHKDEWAWMRFLKTLELWQIVNRYGPMFDKELES